MSAPVPHRDPVEGPGVPKPLPRGRVTVAHVLYMDLVAYSESNTARQAALVSELLEVVRGVPEFQAARNANRIIPLDSGDGLALVFLEDPTAPVRCAIGISQAIRSHPDLRLRMGINTGPVQIRSGISHRRNAFGRGINYAQRAMDRGDAGHILITAEAVSILQDLEGWPDYLHDIGEYEVKHGVMLHLYNCYTDTAGNSATPAKPQGEKPAAQSPTAAAQKPNLIGAILHTYAAQVKY